LCTTVAHNTAQNSSDNFPSYPPDNHHSSDEVYWRGGAAMGNRLVEQKPKAVEVVVLSQLVQNQNGFRLHRTTAPKIFIKGVCTPYGKLASWKKPEII